MYRDNKNNNIFAFCCCVKLGLLVLFVKLLILLQALAHEELPVKGTLQYEIAPPLSREDISLAEG
jgi:hypothetical protein